MTITKLASFLDGGTIELWCSNGKHYYIDNRLDGTTVGKVYDAYPPDGKIISDAELALVISAVKKHKDVSWRKEMKRLLGLLPKPKKSTKKAPKKKLKPTVLMLESAPITVKRKKLLGKWTVELEQELESWYADKDGCMVKYNPKKKVK